MIDVVLGFAIGFAVGSALVYLLLGWIIGSAARPVVAAIASFHQMHAANDRSAAELAARDAIRHSRDDVELEDAIDAFLPDARAHDIGQLRMDFALGVQYPEPAARPTTGLLASRFSAFAHPEPVFQESCRICGRVRDLLARALEAIPARNIRAAAQEKISGGRARI
jgi:hypothetical protein